MNIESVKIVCFSPTGTSKAVAQGIAHGVDSDSTEVIDITNPEVRAQSLAFSDDELLIIAVPVYMGRVPAVILESLNAIQADGTPAVCVVVYGNRVYDDALLELKNIVAKSGAVPVACGAYIGEHSFSSTETPTAHGRPDEDDMAHAKAFGEAAREKLESITQIAEIGKVCVPGTYPYTGSNQLWDVDFIAVSDQCTQCGLCAKVCPVAAVDSQDSALIDVEKCITCCACIKRCPQNAKSIKASPVKDASIRLNTLFGEPKKPEIFL